MAQDYPRASTLRLLLSQGMLLLRVAAASIAIAIAFLVGSWMYLGPSLPAVAVLRDITLQTPLRVYSRDGLLIGEFGEKRRIPVAYAGIPGTLIYAFLAAEDDRFASHRGVDLSSLLRAALEFLRTGSFQSGGSTITMQVARNYFLSRERTISRKLNEILLALRIEQELSKEEIMELYVNKIYLGNRAYGVAAAAQVYYGKSLDEISLAQYAMLASLPKAPSTTNPLSAPDRAQARRDWILGRMLELDYISRQEWQEAVAQPVTARRYRVPTELHAPYVAEMARQEMIRRYGLAAYTGGYRVYTTVDSRLQEAGGRALQGGIASYERRHGYRGPEARSVAEGDPASLRAAAAAMSPVGDLVPTIVASVSSRSFVALPSEGEAVTIRWEQGLADARPYITENRRGPVPRSADEVVQPGDLVRLRRDAQGTWQLGQVPEVEAALVALDPSSGAIRTLVGGFDFQRNKFNHVTQGRRQPGSSLKPFIYTAALENGYTAASIFNDAPVVFKDKQLEDIWRPANAGGRFLGPIRLRRALYESRNLVSVRLLRKLGISRVVPVLEKFGFSSKTMRRDLSLALGSNTLTPLEVVTGFAVFANGGYRVTPYLVERVEKLEEGVVFQASPARVPTGTGQEAPVSAVGDGNEEAAGDARDAVPRAPRILDQRVAYIMNTILHDVIRRGTGRRARSLGRTDLAGKTGTTNGPVDAWFSGYHPSLVATAWVGFDQNRLLGDREYGGSAALPIWIEFMHTALRGVPESALEQPDGLVVMRIDPETGEAAPPGRAGTIFEIFRRENVPKDPGPAHTADNSAERPANGDSSILEDIF